MAFTLTVGSTDQLSHLQVGASLKLQTFDFVLFDPETVPVIGDSVTTTDPDWSGTIASIKKTTGERPGHLFLTISATNTDTASTDAAPFGLSDDPDGSSTYGYSGLEVSEQHNTDGTDESRGQLTCYQSGLWPGMSVELTNTDMGYDAESFTITDVTYTWVRETPFFLVEFGAATVTLSDWIKKTAGKTKSPGLDPFIPGNDTVTTVFDTFDRTLTLGSDPNLGTSTDGHTYQTSEFTTSGGTDGSVLFIDEAHNFSNTAAANTTNPWDIPFTLQIRFRVGDVNALDTIFQVKIGTSQVAWIVSSGEDGGLYWGGSGPRFAKTDWEADTWYIGEWLNEGSGGHAKLRVYADGDDPPDWQYDTSGGGADLSGADLQLTLDVPNNGGSSKAEWDYIQFTSAVSRTPISGQRIIETYLADGDGSTTTFDLPYRFAAGSLEIYVDGVNQTSAISSSDPDAPSVTLSFAPLTGEKVYYAMVVA